MKHLKKFEELSPEIYRSAAKGLTKLGREIHGKEYWKNDNEFKNRSRDLEDWADYNSWKNSLEEESKLGKTKLKVKSNGGEEFDANFYPFYFFNTDLFEECLDIDSGEFEMQFEMNAIPCDEESLKICKDKMPGIDNFYYINLMWLYLKFKIEGNRIVFDGMEIHNETDNGKLILDRVLAGKIRTALINMLSDDKKYPSGYNNINTAYEAIEQTVVAASGLSSEYGLTMDILKGIVSSITANKMLTYIK